MWPMLLLMACPQGPVVPLDEVAAAKAGTFVVEAELKSASGAKAVFGEALEVKLPAKPGELKPGERYRARLSKKGSAVTVTCLEPLPYRCGGAGAVVAPHSLGESGVAEGIVRSLTGCPACTPDGGCEQCAPKLTLDSGDALWLAPGVEAPELGTRVRLAARRVKAGPQGFPGVEVTCVEPVAR